MIGGIIDHDFWSFVSMLVIVSILALWALLDE